MPRKKKKEAATITYRPTALAKKVPRVLRNKEGNLVAIGGKVKSVRKVRGHGAIPFSIPEASQEDLEYFFLNGQDKLIEYDTIDEPDSGEDQGPA